MICKTCGKQFTGAACPTCGIKPASEGRSDELVKLLKDATDSGSKYREGYEKGLQEGYRNGYTAASRDSGAAGTVTVPDESAGPAALMNRTFSFKQFLIAAGACFAVGAILFGLLLGGLRFRSGMAAGREAGKAEGVTEGRKAARAEYEETLKAKVREAETRGRDAAKAEYIAEGIQLSEAAQAEARRDAEIRQLSGAVAAERETAPETPGLGIRDLQQCLKTLGYAVDVNGFPDDPRTWKALADFRAGEGLGDDAVLDRETEVRIGYRIRLITP